MKNFGDKYNSLVIMPSLQSKMVGFDSQEISYPYTFKVSVSSSTIDTSTSSNNLCASMSINLYFGLKNSDMVKCLQQFLKSQGQDIYPEGYVTGYFGSLTKAAVIRFQKKYGIPSTGFVGILTRTKINSLYSGQITTGVSP